MKIAALVLAAATLAISTIAIGWTASVAFSPRTWFADELAQRGPTGERGPRGEQGPLGPPGPVGPDAATAVEDVQYSVDDLASRVDDLESQSQVDDLEIQSRVDDLESQLQEVSDRLDGPCSTISTEYTYNTNSAIEDLLYALNNGC